jgi:hypothetical protein
MHLQVCEGGEREKCTRSLASPRQAGRSWSWRGEARRGEWIHDVHMNSPPKSNPKPRRSTAACRLFLL